MKPAHRTLHGKPVVVDGCLIVHYRVFLSEKDLIDNLPTKFETVVSQIGNPALGHASILYDSDFHMVASRKKVVDAFLNQGRKARPTSRGLVKAEIASTRDMA
jgi:hypothetical protein